jgi:hypothetical protein
MKAEHRMERNHLKGRDGDRVNAVLAAAGYNFGLLLRWLERGPATGRRFSVSALCVAGCVASRGGACALAAR